MSPSEILDIAPDAVIVGERIRRDFGNLDELADNIKQLGLLQPIGVDENNALVFGHRRLLACKQLGWDSIPAVRTRLEDIILGEYAENSLRKDFTISERAAIAMAIEERIGDRRGVNQHTQKQLPGNCPEAGKETRELAAKRAGFGNDRTYRRVKETIATGTPALVSAMDSGEIAPSVAARVARLPQEAQDLAARDKYQAREAARVAPKKKAAWTTAGHSASPPLSASPGGTRS
jgi:ParB family chromosome partitioning protein